MHHPDKNPDDKEQAHAKFQEVSAAYKRITCPDEEDEEEEDGVDGFGVSEEEMFAMFNAMMFGGLFGGMPRGGGPFGGMGSGHIFMHPGMLIDSCNVVYV